jgi:Uma2 family endonuclease
MLKQIQSVPPQTADDLQRRRMNYAQFLEWDGRNPHVEWVDGEVVDMAPISDGHNDLSGLLLALLRTFVESSNLGVIRYEPFQMKTGPKLPGRSPDIMFVARKNVLRLKKTHLEGPADLVIEIISEGSRGVDRGEKYFEYEKGGVREYWLIDPIRKQAEFYLLGRDGLYHLGPVEDDIFRSVVLKGLWLKVGWLWRKPLPSVLAVQKRWKLI